MTRFFFEYLNNYTNHGQNAEQSIRKALTGKTKKADNIPHDRGTDILHYQVKSARATVCKGTDIRAYLETDCATEYIYGTNDGIAYIMSKTEYIEFVEVFGTVTRESTRNGGAEKIRLKSESLALLAYLAERA